MAPIFNSLAQTSPLPSRLHHLSILPVLSSITLLSEVCLTYQENQRFISWNTRLIFLLLAGIKTPVQTWQPDNAEKQCELNTIRKHTLYYHFIVVLNGTKHLLTVCARSVVAMTIQNKQHSSFLEIASWLMLHAYLSLIEKAGSS